MAFRVKDAAFAYKRAIGPWCQERAAVSGSDELNIPSIEGLAAA